MIEPGAGVVAPRLAASLLLVRDAPSFQVLMVERHRDNAVGPGAMVFPGGKLEPQDEADAWSTAALDWRTLDAGSRSLRICAVRETFEETAVLLAQARVAGTCAEAGVDAAVSRALAFDTPHPFLDLLHQRDLVVDLQGLTPFARWITPNGAPARFDAAFFIASAPDDQLAVSDGFETVSAEWIEPLHALTLGERGQRTLMLPTRANLKRLGESRCAAEAIAAAHARPVSIVRPYLVPGSDGYVAIAPDKPL